MARAKSGSSGGAGGGASLALRIATVALSVVSVVMMATSSSQPAGGAPASSSASYSDYGSLRYSLAANVISTALQAAAVLLAVSGKAGEAKAVKSLAELIDMAAKVFLYSSAALSFAVDDFGTCGRRITGVCSTAGEFCWRVHLSGAISLCAGVALSVSRYLKDVQFLDERKSESEMGCGRGCHCHH